MELVHGQELLQVVFTHSHIVVTRVLCRKRCMDLVSIESQQEQNFVGQNMARAGVR